MAKNGRTISASKRQQPIRLRPYKYYVFTKQDPVLALLHTIKDDKKVKDVFLNKETTISRSTLNNWWKRKTKWPQFRTVIAITRVLKAEEAVARLIKGNEYR